MNFIAIDNSKWFEYSFIYSFSSLFITIVLSISVQQKRKRKNAINNEQNFVHIETNKKHN